VLYTFLTSFPINYMGWPLFGMIVSIALNMGLHRDGSLFNLDPYETEIRRRLWSILLMIDGYTLLTAQLTF
jgi:Fungal specific transcription factor domain